MRTVAATILVTACAFGCSTAEPARRSDTAVPGGANSGGQPGAIGRPIPIAPTSAVKVSGAFYVDFPQGPPAVVINYETSIPIDNMPALAAQADELMKFFQPDIEATGLIFAILRAAHYEGSGAVREGRGYGFRYEKGADGLWVRAQN